MHDVTYDDGDRCWVAHHDGEVLGRNHRIGPGEATEARAWLAWLIGVPVPMAPAHRDLLDRVARSRPIAPSGLTTVVLLELLHQNKPGHRTDEYEQTEIGMLWAQACTSLPDHEALDRARACPSGTSGGWIFSDEHPQARCDQWPDTHRHIVLVAN